MLAHPVRREVRWRSALRQASLGRRAALHGVQDRPKDENWGTRIHELSIAMFLHARNPPPLRVSHFPAIPLCETPTPTLNAFSVDWSLQEPPQPRRPRAAFQTDYGAS